MSPVDLRKIILKQHQSAVDKYSRPMDNPAMDIQPDPHEFTRDAWEANAEIWDERMGDEGNDFFKKG
jgi:hypothetical protein